MPRRRVWRNEVIDPAFLPSALDGDKWLPSRHGRFIREEGASGTYWVESLGDPRSVRYASKKGKKIDPVGIEPGHVDRCYSDSLKCLSLSFNCYS
jgi:hypothetical protein